LDWDALLTVGKFALSLQFDFNLAVVDLTPANFYFC